MPLVVRHWRVVRSFYGWRLAKKSEITHLDTIEPRGGATHVQIVNDKGELLKEGVAFCHPKENFSRKEGKKYALIHAKQGMPSDYHPAIVNWTSIPEELKKFV